jgi:hypothetical protein
MGSLLPSIQRLGNKDSTTIIARLSLTLTSVQNKIITDQLTQGLSPEQKLKQLTLSNVYANPADPTTLLAEVLVITEENEQFFITV